MEDLKLYTSNSLTFHWLELNYVSMARCKESLALFVILGSPCVWLKTRGSTNIEEKNVEFIFNVYKVQFVVLFSFYGMDKC